MTAPALPPDCRVYVDGVRMADGGTPGEVDTDPVVLTDLRVTWGRDNSLDQPEPSTCVFTVLDVGGGARALDRLNIGSRIDIVAAALIHNDPTESTIVDPGFELAPIGSTPASSTANATVTVVAGGAYGAHSARVEPVDAGFAATVVFPPAAFSADPSAWDAIPRSLAGQAWHYGLTVARLAQAVAGLPGVTVEVEPVGFTAPRADAIVRYAGAGDRLTSPADALAGWVILAGDTYPPDAVWLGLRVVIGFGPGWDDVADALTWDAVPAGLAWDDLGAALIDDLVLLAPEGGTQRQGAVFSGRVTDLEARYDEGIGGTLIDVTSESHLAELGNRYVGDTPWAAQTLAARFAAIIAASGQAIAYVVDPGVAGYVVTWRDVDSQPAARLLAELAQSAAGALWLATSLTSGPYVWLEDIDARPATAILVRNAHVVTIVPNPAAAGLLSISACDVLLEPVRWQQTTEDDSTRIAVRWFEQTTNSEGNPAPTERTYTIVDSAAESLTGQRRLSLSTQLTTEADADRVGDAVLGRVRTPGWRVGGLTIRLDLAEPLDARLLSLVMSILDATSRIGLGLMLTDLPAWSPAGTGDVPLYLEGGTFSNVDGAWELELLTSDARAQGQADVAWDDVPAVGTTRSNPAFNPRNVAGGSGTWTGTRGFGTGGAGTYSDLTGIAPAIAGNVTTARRKTWTTPATNNAGSGFTIRQNTTLWFPVKPGEVLTISCYLRFAGAGTRMAQYILQFYTGTAVGSEGSVVSQPSTAAQAINPNVWTRLTMTVTVPAGANSVGVFADIAAGGTLWAATNTLDCTAILIERAAAAGSYFDGSSAQTDTESFAWTVSANSSPSTATSRDAWLWDEFDESITWNDLRGVGI